MNLQFKNDYFQDPKLRAAFDIYAKKKFGIDFTLSRNKGIDDQNYIAFSAFDTDECIASIAMYIEKIMVNGKYYKGGHLLTVGTLPEYERKGIQKQIWENVIANSKTNKIDLIYLSTNYRAVNFYKKLGFERQFEHAHIIELAPGFAGKNKEVKKLDVNVKADWELLKRIASNRCPVSERIFIENLGLFLFVCLYIYPNDIYYVKEWDCIIICKQSGNIMVVYDIVGSFIPEHETILQFLPCHQVQFVEYRFCTDKLNVQRAGRKFIEDSPVMVDKNFPFQDDVIFPFIMNA